MKSRCFIICDREKVYADGLAQMLAKKLDFQIHVCSTVEQVKMISDEQEIEILLIENAYAEEVLSELRAKEQIILSEEAAADPAEHKIYKYQPADEILSGILEICLADHHSGIFKQQLYKDCCLIGVYSPLGRIGKTTFAVALGRELARKERVLYLNLETYSGWQERYARNERYTLADLLYYARQEKSSLDMRIGMIAGDMDGLEYIAPMTVSEDLKTVPYEEWEDLLEQLAGRRIYRKIIIDFGECVQGLWKLLNLCRRIYMPVNEQAESIAKLKQFEANAQVLGYKELPDKIRRLEFGESVEEHVRQVLEKEEWEHDTGRAAP